MIFVRKRKRSASSSSSSSDEEDERMLAKKFGTRVSSFLIKIQSCIVKYASI